MTLWKIGLFIFVLAGLINSVLVHYDVGGPFRELTRLSVLSGLVIFIVGLFKRKKVK